MAIANVSALICRYAAIYGGGYLKKEETLSEDMLKDAIKAMELIVFV